ncbi:MAG: DUF1552 domain-containing protein [Planctomycetales bacterium]
MTRLSRRTVLKGLGTAVALPALEAMTPLTARGAQDSAAAPKRMAWLYVPNGVHMQDWTPQTEGADYSLPATLAPLEKHRRDFSVLTGLTLDTARPNGDGPGDHARSTSSFLTGAQALKTSGANIRIGVSIDQVAAEGFSGQTSLRSLELGCERGLQSGNCDSGYSCAYSTNISWKTPATPLAKETNPRSVFERLFSNGETAETKAARAQRQRHNKSILDFALEDASQLKKSLGRGDQGKLDEYLTGVREIEQRIVREEQASKKAAPDYPKPAGVPKEYKDHIRLMFDLMAIAFQADVTRASTFMYANAGSNRSYRNIGVSEGHHSLSHHGNSADKQKKIAKINTFHIEQFAYFLEKLKSIREGDKNLLDSCMIVYGSGISDGNRHNHNDLPILLAGRGGGTIKSGRHIRYADETPLTNLYLSLLERAGVDVEKHGDSNGRVKQLS